jgi:FdhE protein
VTLWERRLRRAEALEAVWPFAGEALRFFRAVTVFQAQVYAAGPADVAALAAHGPALRELVARVGPGELAAAAPSDWTRALDEAWRGDTADDAGAFFTRALLQPFATFAAERWRDDPSPRPSPRADAGRGGRCPFCGRPPAVSLLREDREAGAVVRALVCSLCATEWPFARVLCPSCGQEDPDRLPRYHAEEIPWLRVEACDACGTYVKSVDLSLAPDADPIADELGSTPLDVIARERGYTKLAPNLIGA